MDPFHVFAIQQTLSFVAFGLIARWHIYPRLAAKPLHEALVPLLWIHVFRYAPLTLFAPGQASTEVPIAAVQRIAFGDFVSGLLALAALIALRGKWPNALAAVWIANVFGALDYVHAVAVGVNAEMYNHYIGWSWYILNFYTPMLVVSHYLMFYLLITRRRQTADGAPADRGQHEHFGRLWHGRGETLLEADVAPVDEHVVRAWTCGVGLMRRRKSGWR